MSPIRCGNTCRMHFSAADLKPCVIQHEIVALQGKPVRLAIRDGRYGPVRLALAGCGEDATIQCQRGQKGEMNELPAFHVWKSLSVHAHLGYPHNVRNGGRNRKPVPPPACRGRLGGGEYLRGSVRQVFTPPRPSPASRGGCCIAWLMRDGADRIKSCTSR